MVRHASYHDPFRFLLLRFLLRMNRVVVLGLLWAALAACVIGSLVFDVADWLSAWRNMHIGLLTPVAA
jgi:hypothetical protein